MGARFQHGDQALITLGAPLGERIARVHLCAQEIGIHHPAEVEARAPARRARTSGATKATGPTARANEPARPAPGAPLAAAEAALRPEIPYRGQLTRRHHAIDLGLAAPENKTWKAFRRTGRG